MNTQKKLFLLPYRFQMVGWIILGASLLATIVGLLFSKNPSDQMATLYLGGFLFALLGMLIAGLSREKQEDEFTVFLRTRSALTAISVMLGLRIVIPLIMTFLIMLSHKLDFIQPIFDNPSAANLFTSVRKATGYGGAFALYLILYKIRLVRYHLQFAKEGQEVE